MVTFQLERLIPFKSLKKDFVVKADEKKPNKMKITNSVPFSSTKGIEAKVNEIRVIHARKMRISE
ncbi:hypothetical protein [Shewanella denitrificans]|uniref:hypothetical protein n=1 Tax=Shewanella denitrificans TaxID=192073 RepID=UPI000325DAD5|nr:hypothetical protein [Shewanella denitrificans]